MANRDSVLWAEALAATKRVRKVPVYNKKPKKKKKNVYIPPSSIETAGVSARIKEINSQIKQLKAEKHQLLKRRKPWIIEYEKKPYQLYALELEGGRYYVGISRNPERRFIKHQKGKGAVWTKSYKPVEIIETRMTEVFVESEAVKLENDMTLEYALKFGSEFVRGGGFCQTKPRWPDVVVQNEKIH